MARSSAADTATDPLSPSVIASCALPLQHAGDVDGDRQAAQLEHDVAVDRESQRRLVEADGSEVDGHGQIDLDPDRAGSHPHSGHAEEAGESGRHLPRARADDLGRLLVDESEAVEVRRRDVDAELDAGASDLGSPHRSR